MFAILFEVLLIQIQEEIYHFAGWVGGGFNGHKNWELKFCEQTGFLININIHPENPPVRIPRIKN